MRVALIRPAVILFRQNVRSVVESLREFNRRDHGDRGEKELLIWKQKITIFCLLRDLLVLCGEKRILFFAIEVVGLFSLNDHTVERRRLIDLPLPAVRVVS